MSNIKIETRTIQESEFLSLIEFDDIYLQKAMNTIGVPTESLAPPLTLIELEQAFKRKDILKWIFINHNLSGYFWFEKKVDSIYISGVAIRQEFQGKGIIQYILNLAEVYAKKNQLSKCTLSVSPLNGRALNAYLKHGYKITASIPAFYGPRHPSSFRLILEKNMSKNYRTQLSNDVREILCIEYCQLKHATDNGYVGVELIRTSDKDTSQNKIRFVKIL